MLFVKDIATGEQLLSQPIKVSAGYSDAETGADGVMMMMKRPLPSWHGLSRCRMVKASFVHVEHGRRCCLGG